MTSKTNNPNFLGMEAGEKHHRLTAVAFVRLEQSNAVWKFQCACGNDHVARTIDVRSGHTKSCGCWKRESDVKASVTHGMSYSSEYVCWVGMIQRCYNIKYKGYKNYGGRGITVCERWLNSFENFFADIGRKPSPRRSIDRIDNESGYFPDNCRWATPKEQNRNNRRNRMVVVDGATMTLAEAIEKSGLNQDTVKARLRQGWPIARALGTAAGPQGRRLGPRGTF